MDKNDEMFILTKYKYISRIINPAINNLLSTSVSSITSLDLKKKKKEEMMKKCQPKTKKDKEKDKGKEKPPQEQKEQSVNLTPHGQKKGNHLYKLKLIFILFSYTFRLYNYYLS